MKRIIITGVTGFVGRYFALEMLKAGYEVYGVARDPERVAQELVTNPAYRTIQGALETISVQDFGDRPFDAFFHFAWGGVNRDEIDSDTVHKVNYENSVKCLDYALAMGCSCFLDAGSRMEYGSVNGVMCEDLEPHPEKAYGVWKEKFYQYAYALIKDRKDFDYIHIRIFSVIGVGDHPWSITETACRNFLKNEPMSFGPCTQLWNFMAIEDAVKAIRLLYENKDHFEDGDNRIVNIANYDTRVLRGFIEEIYQITESRSKLVFAEGNPGTSTYADVRKLTTITGWKSEIPYYKEIEKIIGFYREKQL